MWSLSTPLRDTLRLNEKDYTRFILGPHLHKFINPQLLKQQIHQPKNKMQTLLVNKIKDKINQELMMVLHQVMSKIKFTMMSKLKQLSKLKMMIKTGIQMIRLIKRYLQGAWRISKPVASKDKKDC